MSTQIARSEEDDKKRRVTTARLSEMKARGEKIAMLTGYDYSFARILDLPASMPCWWATAPRTWCMATRRRCRSPSIR